ncbi:MAG: VOC family protein, partial [Chthoniobacterales bacterium]
MVTKLLHTRYRVNELEKTVNFYKDVLGLKEIRRHKSPRGSELVFLETPGSEELIEICSYPGSGPVVVGPDLTHLAFEVGQVGADHDRSAARVGTNLDQFLAAGRLEENQFRTARRFVTAD